jgi:hypothetical protein
MAVIFDDEAPANPRDFTLAQQNATGKARCCYRQVAFDTCAERGWHAKMLRRNAKALL